VDDILADQVPADLALALLATMLTLITSFQVFIQPFIPTRAARVRDHLDCPVHLNQGFALHRLGIASAGAWGAVRDLLGVTAVPVPRPAQVGAL